MSEKETLSRLSETLASQESRVPDFFDFFSIYGKFSAGMCNQMLSLFASGYSAVSSVVESVPEVVSNTLYGDNPQKYGYTNSGLNKVLELYKELFPSTLGNNALSEKDIIFDCDRLSSLCSLYGGNSWSKAKSILEKARCEHYYNDGNNSSIIIQEGSVYIHSLNQVFIAEKIESDSDKKSLEYFYTTSPSGYPLCICVDRNEKKYTLYDLFDSIVHYKTNDGTIIEGLEVFMPVSNEKNNPMPLYLCTIVKGQRVFYDMKFTKEFEPSKNFINPCSISSQTENSDVYIFTTKDGLCLMYSKREGKFLEIRKLPIKHNEMSPEPIDFFGLDSLAIN